MIDLIAFGCILFGAVLVMLGMIYRPEPDEEGYEDIEPWQLDREPTIIITERDYRRDTPKEMP